MSKRAEEVARQTFTEDKYYNCESLQMACEKGYELAEKNLGWHSVEESLPPVDEEVIVLTDELDTAPIYKIALGHIVDRMHCSDYNGWNIPCVVWWMPMPKIPNEDE